jgi:hypothetical protein
VRFFSAQEGDHKAKGGKPQAPHAKGDASTKPPTEEELAKNREEWGEKYTDEAFRFEKEWKAISDKIEAQ